MLEQLFFTADIKRWAVPQLKLWLMMIVAHMVGAATKDGSITGGTL
jgi:hypothetical protein